MSCALKQKPEFAIITPEILGGLLNQRMLVADLLSRSKDETEAHAGRCVLLTLDALQSDIEGLML